MAIPTLPPLPPVSSFNLDYIKTKLGINKAVGVGCGMIAWILIAVAYFQGRYYDECTEAEKTRFIIMLENYETGGQYVNETCGALIKGTSQHCQLILTDDKLQQHKDQARQLAPKSILRKQMDQIPARCPPPWLVAIPAYVTGATFLIAFITLIALLLVDLNKRYPSWFSKADFYGHSVIAGVYVLSICMLSGFLIFAMTGRYPCTKKLYDLGLKSFIRLGSISTRAGEENRFDFKTCSDETEFVYHYKLLIAGIVFSVFAIVFHVITIVWLKNENNGVVMGRSQTQPKQEEAVTTHKKKGVH